MVSALGGEIRPANSATEIAPAVTRAEVERHLRGHRRNTCVHRHVDGIGLGAGVDLPFVAAFADLASQSECHDAEPHWVPVRANHKAEPARRQLVGAHTEGARYRWILLE